MRTNLHILMVLTCVVTAYGCATMKHQVDGNESHADLLVKTRDAYACGISRIAFDGKSVPLNGSIEGPYRIMPGSHILVIERESKIEHRNPHYEIESLIAEVGSLITKSSSRGRDQIRFSKATATTYEATMTTTEIILQAESGCTYLFDGYDIKKVVAARGDD